jgi:hypothetical protein
MKIKLQIPGLLALVFGLAVSCGPDTKTPEPVLNDPAGLTVGTLTATSAELSWTGVETAEKYNVEIGGMDAVEVAEAAYEATGLTAETEYTWRVQAVKGDLKSKWVSGKSFTTPEDGTEEPPVTPAPTKLVVSQRTATGAHLSWRHADADTHEVVINDGQAVEVAEQSYQAVELTPETEYTWKVRSCKDGVWSQWAEGTPFTTLKVEVQEPITIYSWGDYQYNGSTFYPGTGRESMNLLFTTLSEDDIDPDDVFKIPFDYICIELISMPLNTDPEIEILDILPGTYRVSTAVAANTVLAGDYSWTGPHTNDRRSYFTEGTVTIEGNHTNYTFKFDLIHPEGRLLGEFNGPLEMKNPNFIPPVENEIDFGTLSHVSDVKFIPNIFGDGMVDGWMLSAITNANAMPEIATEDGWLLSLQLNILYGSDEADGLPDDTYTISDRHHPRTALLGYALDGLGYGAWVSRVENGAPVQNKRYALQSGTVKSTYADGVLTLEVDAWTQNREIHVSGTVMANVDM